MRFFTLNRNRTNPTLPQIAVCDKSLEYLVGDFLWYTHTNGIVYHHLYQKNSSRAFDNPTQKSMQRFEILALTGGTHEKDVQYPRVDYRNHDPLDLRIENLFWLPVGEVLQPLVKPGEVVRTLPGYVEAVAERGKDIAANPRTRRPRIDETVPDLYLRMMLEVLGTPRLRAQYGFENHSLEQLGREIFNFMDSDGHPRPTKVSDATISQWIYGHKRLQKDPEAQEWYREILKSRPPRLQGPKRQASAANRV